MRKRWMLPLLCVPVCAFFPLTFSACAEEEARSSYIIEAEYFPEERLLSAEMTVTVVNPSSVALDGLKFQLWANAYRQGAAYPPVSALYSYAYYDGESYGGIEIVSLSGGEYEVMGEDENILSVSLPASLYPDESVTLKMAFNVTLAKINHRLGVGENAVNLANFYPVLCYYGDGGFEEYVYSSNGDPFVSECADYSVRLTVPEAYTAVYGGEGEESVQSGKRTYTVTAENVRDVAFVLGTAFQSVKTEADGVSVEYYYLSDTAPLSTLAAAADSLTYFSGLFSPYAGSRYVVVETDFVFGGMEFARLSMLSRSLYQSERAFVVAHETAHQWWYAQVGSNQFTEAWQDEGLAEYSAALFMEAYPVYGGSYSETVSASERAYRAFHSVKSQLGGADTRMSRALTAYSGEYEYRSIAYDKGVILFDRLRSVTGDKKFFAALARYAQTYGGKFASREDLLACFEREGAKIEGVALSFLDGLCVI